MRSLARARTGSGPASLGLAAVLSLLVAMGAVAQQAAKARIAVVDLRNTSGWNYWGEALGEAAADQLTGELVNTGEFSVIERDRLQALLAEQGLGQSGALDASTVASIGQLLGVQAIVTGSITKFAIDTKRVGIGPAAVSRTEAEVELDVRVVDTGTGEILFVAEGSAKKTLGGVAFKDIGFEATFDRGLAQEILDPAIGQTVEALLGQTEMLAALTPPPTPGLIVGSSEGSFYIDQGENLGIQVGQRFDVFRVIDEIRDGEGNLLDTLTEQVGVLEVTRVLSQSSICQVVEGEAQEGDTVKP